MCLTERDISILNCLTKFNFLLGRHIKMLFFDGTRACDRRLKILSEGEYLKRQKILYGVPSLYSLAPKGKKAVNAIYSMHEREYKIQGQRFLPPFQQAGCPAGTLLRSGKHQPSSGYTSYH